MSSQVKIEFSNEELAAEHKHWIQFLQEAALEQSLDLSPYRIVFNEQCPTIYDSENRKFKINFDEDKTNYFKIKSGLHKEPLAKALGSGQKGLKLLDLSAGLGIDAVFLNQMGFQVTAVERNPLIYMALKIASDVFNQHNQNRIEFIYSDSLKILKSIQPQEFDLGYFDPMFPEKKKSALPRQEMVMFKNLVGQDLDAENVVQYAIDHKIFKRFVVKRPVGSTSFGRPNGNIEGKIIRYDIYASS